MGPVIIRKRFKFYLNPETVKTFRMVCKSRGLRANRVVEAFMAYCIENPIMIEFVQKMEPSIFQELSKREKKTKRIIKLAEETLKLLEAKQ
jgi:hypothetical protein